MEVKVTFPEHKTLQIDHALTLGELLQQLNLTIDSVLVCRNKKSIIQNVNDKLEKDDFVEILPASFGG